MLHVKSRSVTRKAVAAQRRSLGWTQRQAAEAAGCSVRALSVWETDGDPDYARYRRQYDAALLRELWAESIAVLRSLLSSESERVRVAAASRILTACESALAAEATCPVNPEDGRLTLDMILRLPSPDITDEDAPKV